MQTQVSQSERSNQGSNAQPVCADDGMFCGVEGFASNLVELPIDASGFRVMGQAGFDELELLEARAPELMPVDAAHLSAARGWSRPGDEFLGLGDKGEAEFGFKTLDGTPVGPQHSNWISDDNSVVIELDARADDEQPDQDVDRGQTQGKTRQTGPALRNHGADQAQQGNQPHANSGVEADFWSNSSHELNYPHPEASKAPKMREETK